jgi:imidazoleglycerol-phosphate dehydratase
MAKRTAQIKRKTKETDIALSLNLDGTGKVSAETGVGFFDHMLDHIGRHGLFDLSVKARGDLHVDAHHTIEDVAVCFGQALRQALGDKRGVRRFGFFAAPMDESLAQVAVDLSGRAAFVYRVKYRGGKIGDFDIELVQVFLNALAQHGQMNLHIVVPYGTNNHHIVEAIFKAFGKALRQAVEIDPRERSIPSTKGSL